jgi:hypothetical protein
MFNKAILKNFVAKQLEKKAAEEAKQQAMQQQAMPPQQQMMPPQQQQIPMAQAGTSVTEEPIMGTGSNPNAGVDMRFIDDFKTYVVEPGEGTGRHMFYEGVSNKGEILDSLKHDEHFIDPKVISDVDLKNAVDVKFEGTIEDKKKMLRKLNRQNFWGSRGFRGKGWKSGLSDEEIAEFKEDNPFYKKDRVRELRYDLTNPDASRIPYYNESGRYHFQTGGLQRGGPNVGDEEALAPAPEGLYYDPIRGAGSMIDGQKYFYPERANISYEEDDIYESIFDPRVSDKERKNYLARKAYNDAVAAREKRIAEIERARDLYADVWYNEFPDTTFTTDDEKNEFYRNNPKWQEAIKYLPDVEGNIQLETPLVNKAGYKVPSLKYDRMGDLSKHYPEEVPALQLPYPDIQYNLSNLPEDVDEGDFRQWINTYYPGCKN